MSTNLTIGVRGHFCVRTADGRDMTPTYRKERALLALLAVSSGTKRTRLWLQSKLWSQKDPSKAAANLRRALANLKTSFGDEFSVIGSNRLEVWLEDGITIDFDNDQAPAAELLENVDAPDPAFEDWLRDIRAADTGPKPVISSEPTARQGNGTLVIVKMRNDRPSATSEYFEHWMMDALSRRLQSEGAEEIYCNVDPDPDGLASAAVVLHFDMTSVEREGMWSVHLRVLAGTSRQFLWSGRFTHALELKTLNVNLEIEAFVSQAIAQVFMRFRSFRVSNDSAMMLIQRAASKIYFQGARQNNELEQAFANLCSGESSAVALAWRSFARLVEFIEFKSSAPEHYKDEIAEFLRDALADRPGNPLINSIAARVELDAFGDFDKAQFYARSALHGDDANPYALMSTSRVNLMMGNAVAAHDTALRARKAATGMAHVFAWDMEVCLTALGLGKLADAKEAAWKAHIHNPTHRAALRYLVALCQLLDEPREAQQAARLLERLEPGFKPAHLLSPSYPVLTLRQTGYCEALSAA